MQSTYKQHYCNLHSNILYVYFSKHPAMKFNQLENACLCLTRSLLIKRTEKKKTKMSYDRSLTY